MYVPVDVCAMLIRTEKHRVGYADIIFEVTLPRHKSATEKRQPNSFDIEINFEGGPETGERESHF